jgi:hypothetical protein
MNDPGPIPKALDRTRLVGSYTALRNYLNCPHAMYHRNIAKTYPFVMTEAVEYGNKVHKAFEERIGGRKPLPPEMQKWEHFVVPLESGYPESKLGMTREGKPVGFFDHNVWFRGSIDVLLSNEEGTKAFIADWKTGGSKYEDPFELEIGAVLLQAKYPKVKKIVGRYVWLAEDRLGQMHDLSATETTFERMKHLMDEIEHDRRNDWFEKRKSGLCGFCPCVDCENHFVARPK